MAELFALILLESIPYSLQGGVLKSISYESRIYVKVDVKVVKNCKFDYFHLFQISKVQIFIQGRAGNWLNGLL